MNYTIINDSLIVGSQPQKPKDIDHLKEAENVAYILCLQQDKDIEYWGINFQDILNRCKEIGIHHMRRPVSYHPPFHPCFIYLFVYFFCNRGMQLILTEDR